MTVVRALLLGGAALFLIALEPLPAEPASTNAPTATEPLVPIKRKIKAVNVDGRSVVVNRPGVITLLIGTGEDSQDGARLAGATVYPFQGRPDFQLVVVVDLRDSVATWVPTVVLSTMRSNLDREAIGLKPWFVKNGNNSDPRKNQCVIADFSGTICPLLGWQAGSDDLRGILFDADGMEIKRWSKLEDMTKLQEDVHAALEALVKTNEAKSTGAVKSQGTKVIQPPKPPPPLPPAKAKKD